MTSMLQIVIPCKPLTTNHIYGRSKFGVFLKKEAKEFKKMAQSFVTKKLNFDSNKHYISIEIFFYLSNFYTKKGSINLKAGDSDNFKKLLLDSIFDKLGINDAYICDSKDQKRQGNEDKTVVIIRVEHRAALDHITIG